MTKAIIWEGLWGSWFVAKITKIDAIGDVLDTITVSHGFLSLDEAKTWAKENNYEIVKVQKYNDHSYT